ncbi:MAG: hypothetical protein H6838_19080 [Planctomycetes bacterium]|nr:hypothetical protein [Planctomycetota bacterium]MCB9887603.1 hypothetical protein [Planctomycetota bacterium]
MRPIDRRFTFVEETLHGAPPGHFEYEQWIDWKSGTENDSGYTRFDFKHELEYGLSETVHLAVDLAEWHYEDSATTQATKFDATGVELKVRLSDPRTDLLGFGVKTELEFGSRELEWKNTLLVDKVVDRWEFAYNFQLTTAFEGEKTFEYEESEGEIRNTFGISRELDPTRYLGAELAWEIPLPDWETGATQNVYLGPNFAYHGHEWALGATPMFLLSGDDDEPSFVLRLIFELDF